jgi:membrane fusion protein, copper/silver efflux system
MKKALYVLLFLAAMAFCFHLGQSHASRPVASATPARRILYYEDPMHPQYRSSKPGIAPDCGMDLVPVYSDEVKPVSAVSSATPGSVVIDADRQQLYGIHMAKVEKTSGMRDVRILGTVAVDETRVYRVVAGAEGWVRETYNDSVGTQVKKDQKLAIYYSPEFVALQAGYLSATKRSTAAVEESIRGTQNFADRLRNLGMTDDQIKRLGDSHKVPDNIEVGAPADGFIVARNIAPGLRFERGIELYRIADLSHVWILADVYEDEAQYFTPGAMARVSLPGQNKTFQARVSDVLPQIDPTTRTLKLRLEVDNRDFSLRPDMFVDVQLKVPAPRGLSVLSDALVDSGDRKQVYVEVSDGEFQPREVQIGARFGDRVQIVNGLKEGESVVTSGTFLIDSESRLKATPGQSKNPEKMKMDEEPKPSKVQRASVESGAGSGR